MLKDAESDPALKAVVGDAEPTFKAFMARATALGMDPQYVPELTEARVHELSGERVNTRMGKIIEAGARKESEGHLRRMNAVDRSVEAFLAARTAIHQEIATNMGTEFFRKNFGIEVKKGATWDRGDYAFWNPEKQPIPDGGREAMGVRVAPTDGVLIPKSLARAIKRSNADFTGGFETAYKANKYVMNPWRNAVITASPQFYLNHTLGHAVLATIEGVKLHHWTEAVQKWREAADNPLTTNEATDVGGRSIVSQGTTKEPSMLDAGTAKERAARAEGVSGKLAARSHAVAQKLHNITNVVDGVTRTAVYIAKKEKGYTDAEALNKAISNVVDYNDLSPAEQQIARAIIPFYSFQKQILKIVAKFPVDHPVVLGLGANFGRINQHQMQDAFGTKLPLGYQGLIQTGGGGTVNTRGLNPFKDSFSLASPEGIAAAANPLIAGAIRMGFNAPSGGYVKNRKMDAYGNLVPDVGPGDIGYDVTAQLPGVVEAQALAGAGRGPLRGTLKFAGATTYSPDEMQKLVDRIKGTRAAVDANSPYAPTKKKRRSSGGGLFSG